MADYVLVRFAKVGDVYQEIEGGRVVRYVDAVGKELFVEPPIGESCVVLEAKPVPSTALVDATAAREVKYDFKVFGDRRRGERRS